MQGSATTDWVVSNFDVENNDPLHANSGSGVSCGSGASKGKIGPGIARLNYYGIRLNGCSGTSITEVRADSNWTYGARLENGTANSNVVGGAYTNNGRGSIAGATYGISIDGHKNSIHNYICARAWDDDRGTQTRSADSAATTTTFCPLSLTPSGATGKTVGDAVHSH